MLLISENRKSRDSTTYPESEYLVDGLPVPTEAIRQPYKVPRRVFIVEELPKSLIGKVLRREVRDALLARD